MSSNRIISIYKARTTILEHMERLKYDVSDYNTFNINEVDAMFKNSQLDLLLVNTEEPTKKVYIKYYFAAKGGGNKQIRIASLNEIIEDLYEIDNILTLSDTLIIIIDEEPNDTILQRIKYLFEKSGIFIVIHNLKRLQFNLLEHSLMPDSIEIIKDENIIELKDILNIKNIRSLPEISRFDPISLAIMLRPNQVMKCMRKSITALRTPYYRVCV